LAVHVGGDILDREVLAGGVRGEVGVEEDLVEHVAELLEHGVAVAGLDGVDELVALLDEVAHEALVGLVGVPGASARRAQLGENHDEFVEFRMRSGHAPILPSAFCCPKCRSCRMRPPVSPGQTHA